MFEPIPIPTVLAYCLFSLFLSCQLRHRKHFRGTGRGLQFALAVSVFAGLITGMAFLVYLGWTFLWWFPLILFCVSLLFQVLLLPLEGAIGIRLISFAGFAGWPLCAYWMFQTIP